MQPNKNIILLLIILYKHGNKLDLILEIIPNMGLAAKTQSHKKSLKNATSPFVRTLLELQGGRKEGAEQVHSCETTWKARNQSVR